MKGDLKGTMLALESDRNKYFRFFEADSILMFVVILVLCFWTINRNNIWRDEYNLWQDAVKKAPRNARANQNLGFAFLTKGHTDEGIEQSLIALKLDRSLPIAHNNLGRGYQRKGWFDQAIEQYQIAIKLQPNNPGFHYNLGDAYRGKRNLDEAIEQYKMALSLLPNYADAHNNLGIAYAEKGWLREAIEEFKIAVELDPGNTGFGKNLAQASQMLGQ